MNTLHLLPCMTSTIKATALFLLALIVQGCGEDSQKSTSENKTQMSHKMATGTLPTLSPIIPLEITSTVNPPTLESLQHDFDVFSWQSFIALNWPANADGSPNTNLTIGDQQGAPTVWQLWKESRDIFLPSGKKPPAWNQKDKLPTACQGLALDSLPSHAIYLTQVGKTPNVLDESEEPFQTGPLIDQNGQYTRFEILTNETMFNYIVDNQLYNKKGQKAFAKDTDFPSSNTQSKTVGSIMLKAAWVVMGEKYDARQFHTTQALVYNNPDEQPGVKPACHLETVGLVGFHIAHKTQDEPQWIWSTFEHIANAPTKGQPHSRSFYNYFNAACQDCAINQPPPRPWNPATPHTPPTQVERVIPITNEVKALNAAYHSALESAVAGSVWKNYELISTQWPTNANSPIDPTGAPAPSFLANTTLETYIQGEVPQTSSSCIGCHNNATTTAGLFSDFTYLLQRAH